ncbi:CLUMA_CG005078, isoform A [Clunio marinus]|uniref:CLUMA_CG005078, isoform A n=1 Tax=Clunio marinus TaxID=568069 RepID=A0A1J1HTT1_9DIPT|nr:CLUMA_CG005078, isoform A [Clunio marinus]
MKLRGKNGKELVVRNRGLGKKKPLVSMFDPIMDDMRLEFQFVQLKQKKKLKMMSTYLQLAQQHTLGLMR